MNHRQIHESFSSETLYPSSGRRREISASHLFKCLIPSLSSRRFVDMPCRQRKLFSSVDPTPPAYDYSGRVLIMQGNILCRVFYYAAIVQCSHSPNEHMCTSRANSSHGSRASREATPGQSSALAEARTALRASIVSTNHGPEWSFNGLKITKLVSCRTRKKRMRCGLQERWRRIAWINGHHLRRGMITGSWLLLKICTGNQKF